MDRLNSLISWQTAAAVSFAYVTYLAVQRCYLHPLSRFPGPRLAALTHYYQAYFEIIQDGAFLEHLEKLHAIYGMYRLTLCKNSRHITHRSHRPGQPKRGTVITYDWEWHTNIVHSQLHFTDLRAYAAIYTHGSKFTKDPHFYACFGEDESSFGYTDRREAKARKEVLSPLFSRRSILKLEHVIQEKVE